MQRTTKLELKTTKAVAKANIVFNISIFQKLKDPYYLLNTSEGF